MVYLSETALILIWIAMAWWQGRLIKKNRPIFHGWWALASAILIGAAAWWIWDGIDLLDLIFYLTAQGCSRLVFFNIALNRFRGLPWTYTSLSSGSLMDYIEIRLFKERVWMMEVFAGICFITLQPFL